MSTTIDFDRYQTVARAMVETMFDGINKHRECTMAVVAAMMVVYVLIEFGANAFDDAINTEEEIDGVITREVEDESNPDTKSIVEPDVNDTLFLSAASEKGDKLRGRDHDRSPHICITNSKQVTINLWYMAQTNITVTDCEFVTITHHCTDHHKDEKEQINETPAYDEAADAQYEYDWNTSDKLVDSVAGGDGLRNGSEQCVNDAPETMEDDSHLPPLTAPNWRFRVVKEENAIDKEEEQEDNTTGPFSDPNKRNSPYALFYREVLPIVKAANPGASHDDTRRIVDQQWTETGVPAKYVFVTRSAELKNTAASPV